MLFDGRYDEGWDRLRAERLRGAIREGLLPEGPVAVDYEPGMRPWAELSPEEWQCWARRMSVYAAMVHRLDENVGRLLSALDDAGRLDNTLVIFLADNGAEGHDLEARANRNGWVDGNFDNSPANIGTRTSCTSLGPGWARAAAAPFRDSKSKIAEGGIRVPAFVSFPGGPEGVSGAYLRVIDPAPTILHVATGSEVAFGPNATTGRSLLPYLEGGPEPYEENETVAYEVYGRLAAQRGDWKALRQEPPHGTGAWQLYNLNRDPGEQEDLADEHPAILAGLVADWEDYAEAVGVVLPEHPVSY